ncbi:E3 ubiquitin- ligase DZIP3 [Paramuricea clavata]|uniref:E3 ubiquitin- ligase DZIP3 n=1 Tax=Paramuricea clavata TaxID=317549 RepID=A0A6S7FXN0_PARCT|nr:E3 ubiquitin- ligase DZIP3 [Paramuricea clavata]
MANELNLSRLESMTEEGRSQLKEVMDLETGSLIEMENTATTIHVARIQSHLAQYHGIWSCKVFPGLSVPDRWGVAKEKQLCFRCLASNHVSKDCTRSKPYAVQGCKRSHHNLLHEVVPKEKEEGEKSPLTREGQRHEHILQEIRVCRLLKFCRFVPFQYG